MAAGAWLRPTWMPAGTIPVLPSGLFELDLGFNRLSGNPAPLLPEMFEVRLNDNQFTVRWGRGTGEGQSWLLQTHAGKPSVIRRTASAAR
jgi:hypothetical protein